MKSKYRKTPQHSYKDIILSNFKKKASMILASKYLTSVQYYRSTVINSIIYNEKSHIVALFKDFLIIDDCSEFMKRYYAREESKKRLPKFYDYYDTYSKIFPNYTSILEGKYIYYNIQRKQKIINIQEEMEIEAKIQRKNKHYTDEVFSTDIYDSIVNDRNNEDLEEVFNLNDKSYEEYERFQELLSEIEKNDNGSNSIYNDYTLNQSGSNREKIQPTVKNSISTKKKLMISSLLGRNQSMSSNSNNNNNGKALSLNNNNYNYYNNETQKCYRQNNCNNNSTSLSQSNLPLTDRPSSSSTNKKTHLNSLGRPPQSQSRQVNKTKMAYDYPKTVFNDDYVHSRINKTNDKGSLNANKHCHKKDFETIYTKPAEREGVGERERERIDKSEKAQIKTPPKCTNNIIYIINQNPKFMTNVTLFNNANQKSSSTKNLTLMQSQGQFKSQAKTLSNMQSQLIPKKKTARIETSRGSSKNKIIEQYLFDNQTAKTRNNDNRLANKEFLITSREYSNKDYMNLKTASQVTMVPKNSSKRNINNFITTTKEAHTLKSTSKDLMSQRKRNDTLRLRNDSSSRSKQINTNIIHHGTLNFTNNSNNKQEIKGIQIKDFNKVLGLNFIPANSDRNEKKVYYNR